MEETEIFKKQGLRRTPPSGPQRQKLQSEGGQPEGEPTLNKKRKLSNKSLEETDMGEAGVADVMELKPKEVLKTLYSAIEVIKKACSKEKNGKFSFTMADQQAVRDSTAGIVKCFTAVLANYWELEREKRGMLTTPPQVILQAPPAPQPAPFSYAQISNRPHFPELPKPARENSRTRYATVIKVQGTEDPKEAHERLKKEIDLKEVDGGFVAVKRMKTGKILLESHTEDQRKKLTQVLQKKDMFQVVELKNSDPRLVLTGIDAGYEPAELKKTIAEQNPDLVKSIGPQTFEKGLRYEAKRPCRNKERENWIFRAAPEVFKKFMEHEKVNIDLVKIFVEEEDQVTRCFNCNGFGHVAKHCKDQLCCPRCGSEHKVEDCKVEDPDCPNCKKMGIAERRHAAYSRYCPVYQKKMKLKKNRINYG